MYVQDEQVKRDDLKDLLFELSKSLATLQDSKKREEYFSRLESIYGNNDNEHFRHYYSDIFSCLTLIDSEAEAGSLEVLAENIRILKDNYKPKTAGSGENIDIYKEINKLYDHTNLDIARINYNKTMNQETKSELATVKTLINNLNKDIQKSEAIQKTAIKRIRKESDTLKDQIRDGQKDMQNEYITILGIFAAIVLAFTGGMTFSTAVLEHINAVSPYRLIFVLLAVGLVLINLIWMLIDFIRDINGNTIRKCWIIIIANVVLILGLVVTLLAYKKDWLNNRASLPPQQSQEESNISESATVAVSEDSE